MSKQVVLSERSKRLIAQFQGYPDSTLWQGSESEEVNQEQLINWLKQDWVSNRETRFCLESLRAALLGDLLNSFLTREEQEQQRETKKTSWLGTIRFGLIAFGGTILAICEGFDGISSILGLFTAVPAIAVFAAGCVFAVLSVAVFYGFDLVTISANLGVTLKNSPKLIDIFLDQIDQIKMLRKKIDDNYGDITDPIELNTLHKLVEMLQVRYDALEEARLIYKTALNQPYLKLAKSLTAAIAGILFFGSGYIAGQTVITALTGVFLSTVTATFAPIIAFSFCIGLAALSIYWYVERPGLENLVGRWFGLDADKIDKLADEHVVAKQNRALQRLDRKIEHQIELSELRNTVEQREEVLPLLRLTPHISSQVGSNPHTLFNQSGQCNVGGYEADDERFKFRY